MNIILKRGDGLAVFDGKQIIPIPIPDDLGRCLVVATIDGDTVTCIANGNAAVQMPFALSKELGLCK